MLFLDLDYFSEYNEYVYSYTITISQLHSHSDCYRDNLWLYAHHKYYDYNH